MYFAIGCFVALIAVAKLIFIVRWEEFNKFISFTGSELSKSSSFVRYMAIAYWITNMVALLVFGLLLAFKGDAMFGTDTIQSQSRLRTMG